MRVGCKNDSHKIKKKRIHCLVVLSKNGKIILKQIFIKQLKGYDWIKLGCGWA
jgi:hypothetical protein